MIGEPLLDEEPHWILTLLPSSAVVGFIGALAVVAQRRANSGEKLLYPQIVLSYTLNL